MFVKYLMLDDFIYFFYLISNLCFSFSNSVSKNISRFSDVIVSGRCIWDLLGAKYGALCGKFDLSCVEMKKMVVKKKRIKKI